MTRHETKTRTALRIAAALGIGFALLGGGAAADDACYTADVPFAIELPDGSTHDGGTLKFCTRSFTPVSALHRTYVDGRLAGMFLSRAGTSEELQDLEERQAYFVFCCKGSERKLLEGFARPDPRGGPLETYALAMPERETTVTTRWQQALLGRGADDATALVLVAAVGR